MVDWGWIDRRRSEGASWEEIADDSRSGFSPEPDGTSAGRQLRRLSRERADAPTPAPEPPDEHASWLARKGWPLARIAWFLCPWLGVWAFLALVLPSPIGTYFPTIPVLGFIAASAAALLAIALLRSKVRWNAAFQRTAVVGASVGLASAGIFGAVAFVQGCPVLSPFLTGEPAGWERVPNGAWSEAGAPVFFFYGSVACPFCSASSWAVLGAFERLGNVSGVQYDHSSLSDVYPNTPSVVLANLSLASPYLALEIRESTNDQQITSPGTGRCIEQAFLSAYDPFGGIPFVAIGGTFVHTGTLVDPAVLSGATASQIAQQLAAHNGTVYSALEGTIDVLLAYVVWLNNGTPVALAQDPGVRAVLDGIK
ncbi:MAG TPA: DUF929 family protein [Thermoplasmata archaeon]|nr:DUF929 family protein [Thermoplasmata archaeon]